VAKSIPLRLGIIKPTTIVTNCSNPTTYICGLTAGSRDNPPPEVREWDGPAVLSPRTAQRMTGGLEAVAQTIGIDTGKNTLHLIGLDHKGAIVLREKIARGRIAARLANVPRCLIGIEAGMATHYVARELSALGHEVKHIPPAYAKPFRQGHKNDFRDAHAIAEAVSGRPHAAFQ
jgi:hypothetical protein